MIDEHDIKEYYTECIGIAVDDRKPDYLHKKQAREDTLAWVKSCEVPEKTAISLCAKALRGM